MNIFDLRGPDFLVFYFAVGVATLALVWLVRRTHESSDRVSPVLSDYLEIAYLRGGANEALRVATMNLINRGLIDVGTRDRLHALDPRAQVDKRSERALLQMFSAPQDATSIFSDATLQRAVTDECRPSLARMRLVPDTSQQLARAFLLVAGGSWLAGLAVIKILVALSRGRTNILFLVVESAAFCWLLYKATHPLRTPAGDALVADLQTLFAGLRQRGRSLVQGVDTQDFALLMAVFGMAALPPAFSFDRIFRQAASSSSSTSSSSCGSGCGSSSGGGSSCGGGGSSCGGGGGGSCGGGCGGCGS